MRTLLLMFTLGLVLILATAQTPTPLPTPPPPEAYPGQREHKEPPPGFFCSATAKDKAHKCACKRMATRTKEDPDCEMTAPVEDAKCTVYCHADRCLCPIECKSAHVLAAR